MYMDIRSLLSPISEQSLCGEDLSFSNDFHEIKQAKIQDDVSLDQGDWVTEPKRADWSFIATKIQELLVNQSKDIRLLIWLTEAWAYQQGYAGIAAGLELSQRMLQQYWDQLHPQVEDHDLDQRIGLLQGLMNQLPHLIKKAALYQDSPYCLLDYERLVHQYNNQLKQSDDLQQPIVLVELEQFEQRLSLLSWTQRNEIKQQIKAVLQQWGQLKQLLDQLLGAEAPSFAMIDAQLELIEINLNKIYKTDTQVMIENQPKILPISEQQDPNSTSLNSNITGNSTEVDLVDSVSHNSDRHTSLQYLGFNPQSQDHLQNREQALQMISEIADYFAQYEPHSPVSYLLRQSIQCSRLPLHQWLAQVIKNESSLESIQELLGVNNQNNPSSNW